jgi:hypothetical protein
VFRLNCDMVLDVIVDFARGVPLPESTVGLVESHVEVCAACAARLRRERELTSGLRALAGLTSAAQPPAEMEQRLLDAFAVMHTQTSRARAYSRVWRAAAAVLLVATGVATWMASKVSPDLSSLDAARQRDANGGRGAFDDFMPLPVAVGLPAFESGVIVRIELPVAALPRYGVAIPDTPKRVVQADLLVGQDGQPRAIRVINFDRSAVASRSRP